ncbi:SIS domain-containing protein [Geothrix oryzisoli]|uniref:SIS domain-containing protein n=1 Tax=Geothrix oryzisoli TaxID=2922721 RepID=UPI001FADE035|nr:SIS domain-containing protein [Geothrix oryzisoli]
MLDETREAPAAVARLLASGLEEYRTFGDFLRLNPPTGILTLARGSSDHAAQHTGYLIMARLGKLVTSLPMSLVTLYHANLARPGLLVMAFSQSGQSPDLVDPMRYFTKNGATTVALVNAADSPLAREASRVFPLHAGEERSVAATKSFIGQLVAGARIVAAWEQDPEFTEGLAQLPRALEHAASADWTAGVQALTPVDRLFILGRGTGLAIAQEAALKLKETCGIQAEAFSGAEVRHGPMAIVEAGFPLLIFAPRGPAQAGLIALADDFRAKGARVLLAAPPDTPGTMLPLVPAPHPELDTVTAIQSFYPMVEALSRARGFDPDHPQHLSKVTRTR